MAENWFIRAEEICFRCGGLCCNEARPPISGQCYHRLLKEGVPEGAFERKEYRYIKTRSDGTCYLCTQGKCGIHTVKPETCRAGPFTFDVRGDTIDIFLKYESICPLVRLLKEVPESYDQQYNRAVESITRLVAHLTENEIDAICRIDEPETEKVAEIPRRYGDAYDYRH